MALPYIKLYPGDFFTDTAHLTGFEKGVYLLLLMHQWQFGTLPSDNKSLALMVSLTPEEWSSVAKRVLPFFDRVDGKLVQPRMARDRVAAMEKCAKLSEAAKASHKPTSLRNKHKVPANAEQKHMPPDLDLNAESPKTPESKKDSYLQIAQFETFWAAYPRRDGRKAAYVGFFDALHRGASAQEIIDGARRYAMATAGEDQRFVMMPGKWLDGDRWQDELSVTAKPKKSAFSLAADEIRREMGWTKREDQHDETSATIIDLTAKRG